MKLPFDENVSHRLAEALADVFPGSSHVRSVGLRGMEDRQVWEYAREDGFAIVSKDTDFRERGMSKEHHRKLCGSMSEMRERRRSNSFCVMSTRGLNALGNQRNRQC